MRWWWARGRFVLTFELHDVPPNGALILLGRLRPRHVSQVVARRTDRAPSAFPAAPSKWRRAPAPPKLGQLFRMSCSPSPLSTSIGGVQCGIMCRKVSRAGCDEDNQVMITKNPQERRRNKMFVTRNTEYFLRDDVCVGVRDRRTDSWLEGHLALGRELSGGVRVLQNGEAIPVPDTPQVGEALYFSAGGRELITSALCSVERPPREIVMQYAS